MAEVAAGKSPTTLAVGDIADNAITDAKVASDVTIASVTGAVGSVAGNIGGNVVGSVGSVTGLTVANLDATISSRSSLDAAGVRAAIGMALADLDAQLDAILAAGGGAGSGARTVAITVNDGLAALQNARVRVTNGAETYVLLTNASGLATFALDDATWSVVITKALYIFTPTSLVVNGNETQTYSMSLVAISVSSAGKATGYGTVLDLMDEPIAGKSVRVRQVTERAVYEDGIITSGEFREAQISSINGFVEFVNLIQGATYQLWYGRTAKEFVVPNSSSPFKLPRIVDV